METFKFHVILLISSWDYFLWFWSLLPMSISWSISEQKQRNSNLKIPPLCIYLKIKHSRRLLLFPSTCFYHWDFKELPRWAVLTCISYMLHKRPNSRKHGRKSSWVWRDKSIIGEAEQAAGSRLGSWSKKMPRAHVSNLKQEAEREWAGSRVRP